MCRSVINKTNVDNNLFKHRVDNRPTFLYQNSQVRAAGILVYTYRNGEKMLLFRKIDERFEDMGGKTEKGDLNAKETAIRECVEETNGKLFDVSHTHNQCYNIIKNIISNNCEVEYNKKSKYLLFKLNVNNNILKKSMKRFGLEEKTCNKKYYYKWMIKKDIKLHPRLKGLEL